MSSVSRGHGLGRQARVAGTAGGTRVRNPPGATTDSIPCTVPHLIRFLRFLRLLAALVAFAAVRTPTAWAQQVPEQQALSEVTSVALDSGGGIFADGFLGLIIAAGPVAWLVLATLLFFSVVSWAVILTKSRALSRAEQQSAAFLQRFRKAERLTDVADAAERMPPSPLLQLFRAGYDEVLFQSRTAGDGHLRVSNLEAVARRLLRAASTETARFEQRMTFLATTGGATPFIGLFGTVWGIMQAFRDIAATQAANISVVAPGVSEALIATAAGLAAAIPAVIAYNAFLARIRTLGASMDDFSMEYVALLERHLVR